MSDLHIEREPPVRLSAEWLALDAARRAVTGHPEVGPLLDGLLGQKIDLIALPGDIGVGTDALRYAEQVALFLRTPAVTVLGNHELYDGRDWDLLVPEMRAAARATRGAVTFLENEAAVFDFDGGRLHVLGCTLWTDYEVNGSGSGDIAYAMRDAENGLNDHARIYMRGRLLTPSIAREMHMESRAWLRREVARVRAEDSEARIMIVTHHAPVLGACGPERVGSRLSPAFVSDLTTEIAAWRPAAWVWGHTHYSMRSSLGRTQLISAQRGYVCAEPGAESFLPLILEVK